MYNDHLFRVSIKCLITNPEGEVLVVKETGRGSWDLPGGGIEHGEDIRAAIARELSEEISFKGGFTYEVVSADNPAKLLTRDVWQLKLIFRVTLDSTDISPGKDADEIAFIDPAAFENSNATPEQKIYEYSKSFL